GALIVLVLEQVDRRIRTRQEAELAFGLPVLAEVPRYRLTRSARDVVIQSAPMSRSAEAYRSLRTLLLAGRMPERARVLPVSFRDERAASGDSAPGSPQHTLPVLRFSRSSPVNAMSPFVVGVVCSEIEHTRPTAVGNLAAAFAEQGRSVLIVAVDRGQAGQSDDETDGPGPRTLEDVTRPSVVRGVRRAVLSLIDADGGDRAEEMRILLDDAKRSADVVVLDTTPVLLAHDASALASLVDSMVIVAEGRRTTREQARRCSEVLARVEAPVVGVLLTQAAIHRSRRVPAEYRWPLDPDQSNGRRNRRRQMASDRPASEDYSQT
ncbi:MAG: hypothetical protein M3011_06895, partial [Actinomycetota bacterium]|nr:hypothetical protein [Actinomycetota bacterium]